MLHAVYCSSLDGSVRQITIEIQLKERVSERAMFRYVDVLRLLGILMETEDGLEGIYRVNLCLAIFVGPVKDFSGLPWVGTTLNSFD